MLIATNSPFSFSNQAGVEFSPLSDNDKTPDALILVLKKNWGADSIQEIYDLLHWIEETPVEIPCYLIGCEFTFPNTGPEEHSLEQHAHMKRDRGIQMLCDEVLRRSASIGVRTKATYEYLTTVIGYSQTKIDIIFDKARKSDHSKLNAYLVKNNPSFLCLTNDLMRFQRNPVVMYEKPIKNQKTITISAPIVREINESVRLEADIIIDLKKQTIWCETSKLYKNFLTPECCDAFLSVVLPFAMRAGKDIVCEAPVSEMLLHNLREILIPHLCTYDERLYESRITAPLPVSAIEPGNAVATGMSCGVDSMYSTTLYLKPGYPSMKLTHLYCGNYLYGNKSLVYKRAEAVADKLGLPLVTTKTNLNEALNLPHLYTHFYKTLFGVLALRKLFGTYYYSSAEDLGDFDLSKNATRSTIYSELLLLYTFSCDGFKLITGGGKSHRVEKTRALIEFEVSHDFLNVCLYPNKQSNCEKCVKTLLILDMLNALHLFKSVFDIDDYMEKRVKHFGYLCRQKHTSVLAPVYAFFLDKEPGIIAEATVN